VDKFSRKIGHEFYLEKSNNINQIRRNTFSVFEESVRHRLWIKLAGGLRVGRLTP
jgi:hypothetical protein